MPSITAAPSELFLFQSITQPGTLANRKAASEKWKENPMTVGIPVSKDLKHEMSTLWQLISICTLFSCFFTTGCSLVKLKQDQHESELLTVIVGYVSASSAINGPLIVAAYSDHHGEKAIAHYTVLHDRGEFELMVSTGNYYVFAYIDENSNLIYDEGEHAGQYGDPTLVAAPAGGVVSNINIFVSESNRPIDWRVGDKVAPERPQKLHSRLAGAIVDLDDERFSDEHGGQGFWTPNAFYRKFGGTISFLEEYDPGKIPILFIHGAGGTPRGWKYFADNIDRTRFQPWFFSYPSGARIRSMSHLLLWKLLNLQAKYKFDTLYITAHSMGGLVARSFIQDHSIEFPFVTLFISLATPWGGDKMAEYGVRQSPAVIPCWIDMQPEGDLIQSLYRRKMPDRVSFYMFYGHQGNRNPFSSNNDGTITLSSLLDRRPQAEAKMSYAFDEDHTSIVSSREVLEQFNAIINTFDAEDRVSSDPSVGYIKLNYSYNSPDQNKYSKHSWGKLLLRSMDEKRKETFVVLGPDDNGKELGPFHIGNYEASVFVEGFRSLTKKVPVSVAADHSNELDFVLAPDGVLSGYVIPAVKQENKFIGMPSWDYRPDDNTIQVHSVMLKGGGGSRTLQASEVDGFNWSEMEISRNDYCYKGYLRFFGLPAGEYELTIEAEGYKVFVEKRLLVNPGVDRPFEFFELTSD